MTHGSAQEKNNSVATCVKLDFLIIQALSVTGGHTLVRNHSLVKVCGNAFS